MINIKKRILEVLKTTHLMSLATNDQNGPWVADVVFVHDKDLNIYWMSDPNTRHSKAISLNKVVAGTITYSTKSKELNFGIQFEGKAEKLEGIQINLLTKHLAKRSRSRPTPSQVLEILNNKSWYKLTPTKIYLIDEENFGFNRQELE